MLKVSNPVALLTERMRSIAQRSREARSAAGNGRVMPSLAPTFALVAVLALPAARPDVAGSGEPAPLAAANEPGSRGR